MAKPQQLKTSKSINKKLGLIFVALFALVGGASLYLSQAGGLITTIYGYKDVNSFYITNASGAPVATTPIADYLNEAGGSMGAIQVVQLNNGDDLNWGGKGHVITNLPAWKGTTTCYTMRLVNNYSPGSPNPNGVAPPASVSIASGRTTATVAVRTSSLTADYPDDFWQYSCVKDTKTSGTYSPYSLKVISGGPIRVYRADILQYYNY
jgi:hypothetical protein